MNKADFEEEMRRHVHREPFVPFAVELRNGRRVVIKQLPVVYDGEGAGFIDPENGALVDFGHDEVTSFCPLEMENIMTVDEFETELRQNLHREPFVPFVVHLRGGRTIVVTKPPVVFAEGAASFIDMEKDELVEFFHDDVDSFGLLEKEISA